MRLLALRPLVFRWPYWPIFLVVFLWAYLPEFAITGRARKTAAGPDSQDAGSFRVVVLGTWLASNVAFLLAWLPPLKVAVGLEPIVFGLGVTAIVGGSLLRRHCWRQLGAFFTGDVRVTTGQTIIQTGAYSIVRHPAYTAGILMNLGTGLALGSWASGAVMALGTFAVYRHRIAVEEAALLEVIGQPYRDFMKARRYRLVPYVW